MPVEEKRELRGVPLDDLKPYPRNPRKNDDAEIDRRRALEAKHAKVFGVGETPCELPRPEGRGFLLHGQRLHHRDVM